MGKEEGGIDMRIGRTVRKKGSQQEKGRMKEGDESKYYHKIVCAHRKVSRVCSERLLPLATPTFRLHPEV